MNDSKVKRKVARGGGGRGRLQNGGSPWRKYFCVCCTLCYCFMSLESFDDFLVRISTENKAILLEKLVSVLCQIRVM